MAKDKLETDEFDLDSNLDFDSFDDNGSKEKQKKDRSPVTDFGKGVISGVKSKFTDPNFLYSVSKKALPEQYGEIADPILGAVGTVSSLYDESIREIKPKAAALAKSVDSLVPESNTRLKKLTSKIKNWIGDETDQFRRADAGNIQEQAIQNSLSTIFEAQQEAKKISDERETAKEVLQQNIETKRFRSNFELLNNISHSNQLLSNYTVKVTQAYQKKSLELQFRSYFVQAELLNASQKFFEMMKTDNQAIIKNTGLPDYVKMNENERFWELSKERFIGNLQNKFYNSDVMKSFKENLTKKVKEQVGNFKDSLDNALFMADSAKSYKDQINDLRQMSEEFGIELGPEGSGAGLLGILTGGEIGEFAGDKLGKLIRSKIPEDSKLAKALYKNAGRANNLEGFIEELKKSDFIRDNEYELNLKGMLSRLAKGGLDLFNTGNPDTQFNKETNILDVNKPAVYSNRAQKSITDVIPGYLARILREITVIRTKDESTGLTLFNYDKNSFSSENKLSTDIKDIIRSKISRSSRGYSLDKSLKTLAGDTELSEDQQETVKKFISGLSHLKMEYSPENIKNTNLYKNLKPEQSKLIDVLLKKKFEGKDVNKDKSFYEVSKSIRDVRNNTPDIRAQVESLINAGYGEQLSKEGIVYKDESGSYRLNEDNYKKLVDDVTIGESDYYSKEGISAFNPNKALDYIKNTKVYKWLYKKGKGIPDGANRIGPMAQQVNKNYGEEAAPGGTKLDLITMNGYNMAAIQALNDKIEGSGSDTILKSIKGDTEIIVNLLSGKFKGIKDSSNIQPETNSDIGTYSKNSYTDIVKTMFGTAVDLVTRVGHDLFTGSTKLVTDINENAVKPGIEFGKEFYKENKDKVKEGFGSLFSHGLDFAKKIYDFGSDVLTNKLPLGINWLVNAGKQFGKFVKNEIFQPVDIYIKDTAYPVLRANLIKAGEYIDVNTGKVIESVKDITGDVVNKKGEIVLLASEVKEGLFNVTGERILSPLMKAGKIVGSLISKGLSFGNDVLKKLLSGTPDFLSETWDSTKNTLSSIFGGGMGNDKVYNVLLEIRDIMLGTYEGGDSSKYNGSGKGTPSSLSLKSVFNKAKQKIVKAQQDRENIKNKVTDTIDKTKSKTSEIIGNSSILSRTKDFGKGIINRGRNIFDRFRTPSDEESFFQRTKNKFFKKDQRTYTEHEDDGTPSIFGRRSKTKDKFSILNIGKKLIGGKLGGIATLAGGLLGMGGSSTDSTTPQTEEDRSSENYQQEQRAGAQTPEKQKGVSESKFNDPEGSGERTGGFRARLAELDRRNRERKYAKAAVDLTPKYKSDQNVLDTIADKAKGLFDFATNMLGGTFGKLGTIFEGAKGLFSRGKGIGGKLLKAGVDSGKTLYNVGKYGAKAGIGLAKGYGSFLSKGLKFAKGGIIGAAATMGLDYLADSQEAKGNNNAASLARVGSKTAEYASYGGLVGTFLLPGLGSGAGAAIGGAIGLGMGIYEQYLKSPNSIYDFQKLRLMQYGLEFVTESNDKAAKLLELEQYLSDGRIGFQGNTPYINRQAVDPGMILQFLEVDPEDKETFYKAQEWFNQRFAPFYLKHIEALFSVNPKIKLTDIKQLTPEEQVSYLGKIGFESGPYNISTSPFKDIDNLFTDKQYILNFIKNLSDKIKVDIKPKKKPELNKPASQVTNKAPIKQDTSIQTPKPNMVKEKSKTLPEGLGEDGISKESIGSIKDDSSKSASKLALASGPLRDGSTGMHFIKLADGVKIDSLNEALLKNFKGMAQEYGELTGKSIFVTSGSRTSQEQAELYKKNPDKAAKPGYSMHEFGLALDVDSKILNELDKMGLMRKYGFTRPVGGEPWHTEPAGVQVNLAKAKADINFANNAVEASLFKGGGGYGADSNSALRKRNPELALSLLNSSDSKVSNTQKSETISLLNNKGNKDSEQQKTSKSNVIPFKQKESVTSKLPTIAQAKNDSEYFGKNSDMSDMEDKKKFDFKDTKKLDPKSINLTNISGNAQVNKDILEQSITAAGITDPTEKAMFMAQMHHETGGFKYLKELGGPSYFAKYEGRKDLGNTQPGDGIKYPGRGFIHLTGKENYNLFGKKLGVDLVNNPDAASDPVIASKVALTYWQNRGLSTPAENGDVTKVTKIINGGLNGLSERKSLFERYLEAYKKDHPIEDQPLPGSSQTPINKQSNVFDKPEPYVPGDSNTSIEKKKQPVKSFSNTAGDIFNFDKKKVPDSSLNNGLGTGLTTINTTLETSLQVQKQTLDVLKEIKEALENDPSSKNLEGLTKALTSMVPTNTNQKTATTKLPESQIDLVRRTA